MCDRQVPGVAWSGCRTSGSVLIPVGLHCSLVGVPVHFLVFHTPPQPFDKHVVTPAAGAIHADGDVVLLGEPRELLAGELTPLIGVEELRYVIPSDRLLHSFQAKVGGKPI